MEVGSWGYNIIDVIPENADAYMITGLLYPIFSFNNWACELHEVQQEVQGLQELWEL